MKTLFLSLFVIVVANCCGEFKSKSCSFTLEVNGRMTNCKCNNKPIPSNSDSGCVRERWECTGIADYYDDDFDICSSYGLDQLKESDKPADICLKGGHNVIEIAY